MKIVSRMAALTFATLLVSSLALAGGTAAPAAKTASAGKTTTHQVSATVVSVDTKTHSITLKDDQGQEHTAPAMGNAIKEIATLKPGDKVTATCKDSEKGEHLGVVAIKPAK
ncbi:MAG TPA: hypothetical protein VMR65_00325 [Candidatus Sulfotelmatobacter sp.]|jgi:Cu/Ag efflux protein CusF|nr:hypothetical protein [Candidatus Sulfotelmatobacter sp.]